MIVEEVVALEPEELTSHFSLANTGDLRDGDLRDGDLGVVIADPCEHAPEELQSSRAPLKKRFGAVTRKSLNEDGIGVRKCDHEQGEFDGFV